MQKDYQMRAEQFGFASPEKIMKALSNNETHVLDVRTPDEIAEAGRLEHPNWIQTGCTPFECAQLSAAPEEFVQNKDATVVIYCRTGRRASKAKEVLESKGYSNVLNAGGYDDVVGIMLLGFTDL